MSTPQKRTIRLLQLLIVLCLVTPVAGAAYYVWLQHQRVQAQLDELAPRYARLQGLSGKKADFEAAAAALQQDMARWAHPSASEPGQNLGTEMQEKLRGALVAQKLDVVSLQLQPPKTENGFETFSLGIKVEGDMAALTAGLAELGKITPAVRMDVLAIQAIGAVRPASNPRLAAQLTLSVLRGVTP